MDSESTNPIRIYNGRIIVSSVNAAVMEVLIIMLVFFTLLTPRDALGVKKALLFISLAFGIRPIIEGLGKNKKILVFAIVLPAIMYIVSTINTGSPMSAFSYLYPFVYLLLIFPIIEWKIDIKKIAICVGNIMAFIILMSCLFDFIGVMSIYSNPLLSWLNNNGEAKISKSVNAMFRYVLFFNASPILFFNLTHYIKENKKIYSALILVALLFTGTRANIYLGAALVVFAMLVLSKSKTSKAIVIITAVLITIIFGAELVERYHTLAFAKAAGDLTRTEGFTSIINALNSRNYFWFTGMGFGSSYYNAGRHDLLQTSELSFLEFIREIGLPLSLCVFCFQLYPLIKSLKWDKYVFAAYGAYLFAGVFEPFIFTSTGFLIVLIMYVEDYRFDNQKCVNPFGRPQGEFSD